MTWIVMPANTFNSKNNHLFELKCPSGHRDGQFNCLMAFDINNVSNTQMLFVYISAILIESINFYLKNKRISNILGAEEKILFNYNIKLHYSAFENVCPSKAIIEKQKIPLKRYSHLKRIKVFYSAFQNTNLRRSFIAKRNQKLFHNAKRNAKE